MSTTVMTLPATRREFREWLRSHGFPKRFCERVAAAFPEAVAQEEPEPDDEAGLSEILAALQRAGNAMKGSGDV